MKKGILLLLGLILFTSCDMTEKVYIDENGDVKYSISMDMDELVPLMAMKASENDELPIDSIMTIEQFTNMDSTPTKGIREDMENEMELLKDFKVHLKMNEEVGFMDFFIEKRSIKDFNKFMKDFDKKYFENKAKREKENAKLPDSLKKSGFDMPFYSSLRLEYDGNTFKRVGELMDVDSQEEGAEEDEFSGMFESMMGYKLEYHFPRPVKYISDTTVLMSWDRKTIYLKKPMKEVMENPDAYNFTVELED